MKTYNLKQGDIIFVNFEPSKGHEQQGKRPALVVSNNDFNRIAGAMIKLVPISTTNHPFPLHIPLPSNLKTKGVALVEQETVFDLRARNWHFVEHADNDFTQKIIKALLETY